MRTDADGEFWVTSMLIGAAVGVAAQYIGDVFYNIASGKTAGNIFKPSSSVVDYVAAGTSGALASTGIGTIGAKISNVVIDGTAYLLNHAISGEEINNIELVTTVAISALTSEKGMNSSNLRGIYKRSTQALETAISPKKIAMYTSKIYDIKSTVAKKISKTIGNNALSSGGKGLSERYSKSLFFG